VSIARFDRVLVVGGSGMLAGCCRRLLAESVEVTVLARNEARIRSIAPGIVALTCDSGDARRVASAIEPHAFDLVVAWIHGRSTELRRLFARRVRPGGRFVQVLGSAHGDPARPDRLLEMADVAADLPLSYQAVVLGFVRENDGSRWLTDAEISNGVFAAIDSGVPLSIVGTAQPWSARP